MLRIGTRASPLSLMQTHKFASMWKEPYQIIPMETTGDRIQNVCLKNIGGKGLFSKELHHNLLNHKIDVAIHSLKDLDSHLPEGIEIGCVFDQEEREDVLLLRPPLQNISEHALVGTCSPRRQALLNFYFPSLRFTLYRGNVGTRLHKLLKGEVDATILSLAGLKRLGLWKNNCVTFEEKLIFSQVLSLDQFPCAVGQGFLVATCRAQEVQKFHHLNYFPELPFQERALLRIINGTCHTVLGVDFRNSLFKACYTPSFLSSLFWAEAQDIHTLGKILKGYKG